MGSCYSTLQRRVVPDPIIVEARPHSPRVYRRAMSHTDATSQCPSLPTSHESALQYPKKSHLKANISASASTDAIASVSFNESDNQYFNNSFDNTSSTTLTPPANMLWNISLSPCHRDNFPSVGYVKSLNPSIASWSNFKKKGCSTLPKSQSLKAHLGDVGSFGSNASPVSSTKRQRHKTATSTQANFRVTFSDDKSAENASLTYDDAFFGRCWGGGTFSLKSDEMKVQEGRDIMLFDQEDDSGSDVGCEMSVGLVPGVALAADGNTH